MYQEALVHIHCAASMWEMVNVCACAYRMLLAGVDGSCLSPLEPMNATVSSPMRRMCCVWQRPSWICVAMESRRWSLEACHKQSHLKHSRAWKRGLRQLHALKHVHTVSCCNWLTWPVCRNQGLLKGSFFGEAFPSDVLRLVQECGTKLAVFHPMILCQSCV